MRQALRWREVVLNLLLLLLVVTSLALSVQVWYPVQELFGEDTTEPSLQPQPRPTVREMPEIFRPERILVRDEEGKLAEVHTGSPSYDLLWGPIRQAVTGLDVSGGAALIEELPEGTTTEPSIQLHLPTALTVNQWADLWSWEAPALRNGSIWVDRLTVTLGDPASVYLSGPLGFTLFLTDLPAALRLTLLGRLEQVDPNLYRPFRTLELADLGLTALPDVQVPVVDRLPPAQVTVSLPDQQEEEARYFPDLSVVRQIDERDARSLTDGQRLLRLTGSGVLQYRTADVSEESMTPALERALEVARQWVGSRGGWPQDLVLQRYVREPGRGRLEFAVHSGGAYPVESLPGTVQVHVSSAERVVFFERNPTILSISFAGEPRPIVTPEAALAHALPAASILRTEPIRAMYLTYLLKPLPGGEGQWVAEPAWVIRAADTRVYIYAGAEGEVRPPKVIP